MLSLPWLNSNLFARFTITGSIPIEQENNPEKDKVVLLSLLFLAQFRQHGEIFQGRRILGGLLATGDVAEQPAHDFAGARLGQAVGEANVVGPGQSADLANHVFLQLAFQVFGRRNAATQGDEADKAFALELIWPADNRGLRDLVMMNEGALDFHRAQAVAGHIDDVIDPAHDPEIAVFILARAVRGKVAMRHLAPVLL